MIIFQPRCVNQLIKIKILPIVTEGNATLAESNLRVVIVTHEDSITLAANKKKSVTIDMIHGNGMEHN